MSTPFFRMMAGTGLTDRQRADLAPFLIQMDARSAVRRASRRYYRNPTDKNKVELLRLEQLAYPEESTRYQAFMEKGYFAQQKESCAADLEPDSGAWNENP